jgi:mono/diheme cytochrome c family protein
MKRWWYFVIGAIVGVGAVATIVFGYFKLGFAPVAANAAPMPFEKMFAQAALHAHRKDAANVQPPIAPNEANLLAGARAYRNSCAVCHSLPEHGKTDLQAGMYPSPPMLLSGKGVTDDPPGETHWVIRNGIRMTGMPAFADTFNDEKLWQVTLLLAHANDLPPSVQQILREPDSVPVTSVPRSQAADAVRH